MGQVLDQVDRDQQIWREWVNGSTMATIGERRGMAKSSISDAIRRYLASVPPQEREAYRERTLERLEALYHAHREQALERPRVAAIVRGILDSEARLLGLVETQVQVQGQVDHVYTPGPTVQELLERWLAEGRIRPRAELVRTDQ